MNNLNLQDTIISSFDLIGEDESDILKKDSKATVADYLYYLLSTSSNKNHNFLYSSKHKKVVKVNGRSLISISLNTKKDIQGNIVSLKERIENEAISIIKKLDDNSFENMFAIFHKSFRDSDQGYSLLRSVTLDISKPTWKNLKHSPVLKGLIESKGGLNINERLISGFSEICIDRKFNINSELSLDDFFKKIKAMDIILIVEKYELLQRLKPYLYMNFASEDVRESLDLYFKTLKSTWRDDFLRIKNHDNYVIEDKDLIFKTFVDLFENDKESDVLFIKSIAQDFFMNRTLDCEGVNMMLSALLGLEEKYKVSPSEYLEKSFFVSSIIQVEEHLDNTKLIINNNALNKLKTMAILQVKNKLKNYFEEIEGFSLFLTNVEKNSVFIPKQESFLYRNYAMNISKAISEKNHSLYIDNNNGIIEVNVEKEDAVLIKELLEAPVKEGFDQINDWAESKVENYLMKIDVKQNKVSSNKTRKF